MIFDVSDNQVKSWTINGHYETTDFRYPVYDSTTYNKPDVYDIVYEDGVCYLKIQTAIMLICFQNQNTAMV